MAFIADIVTQLRRLESALNEALLRLQQAQDTRRYTTARLPGAAFSQPAASVARLPRRNAARSGRRRVGQAHDAAARSRGADRRIGAPSPRLAGPTCAKAIFRPFAANCSPTRCSSASLRYCTPGRTAFAASRSAPAKHRVNRCLQRHSSNSRRALADTATIATVCGCWSNACATRPKPTRNASPSPAAMAGSESGAKRPRRLARPGGLVPAGRTSGGSLALVAPDEQHQALARADVLLVALSPALVVKTGGASRS